MIDIHSHIIPFIDHGSTSIEKSIEMVKDELNQGVTDIILTPHYPESNGNNYLELFNQFKSLVSENSLKVNLYLGNEVVYSPGVYKKANVIYHLMNNHSFVLLEFNLNYIMLDNLFNQISDIIYDFKLADLKVIFAHIERYNFSFQQIKQIKELGGLIEVSASSFFNYNRRLVLRLMKHNLVDFVSSDVHEFRKSRLKDAYTLCQKKKINLKPFENDILIK